MALLILRLNDERKYLTGSLAGTNFSSALLEQSYTFVCPLIKSVKATIRRVPKFCAVV